MRSLAVCLAALTLVSCSRDPNVAKKRYLENGNKYFARGKYREASIMYRNALQKDQRYGLAYYHLALTDLKLNRVPNALGEFRRAIELIPASQPEHVDSQVHLAEIYLAFTRESQYLAEVEGIIKELLARDPNSYDGHRLNGDLNFVRAQSAFHAGQTKDSLEDLDRAIAEYRKAASIKPPTQALRLQLARALAAGREFPEAEDEYRQLIAQDPALVPAYNQLYAVYLAENKTAAAEQLMKDGAARNPKQVSFLVTLAAFYQRLNRQAEMVSMLNQIESHAKDFQRAYEVVGDFYFRSGDMTQALQQYKQGMAADPQHKTSYQKRMIEVLMRQNRRAEAADVAAAILKEDPRDADARGLQASLMLDRGEVQKAISELQAVVNQSPENFVARYNLGRAHEARAEWEQARQQFTEAIRERPDYLPARLALAQLQVLRGEYDPALKSVEGILQIDSGNIPAHMIQAAALLGQKKYTEARDMLLAVQRARPDDPDVNYSLGMVALKEGNLKTADDIFRKAYAANPQDARGLVGLMDTFAAEGRLDEAVQFLQGETAKNPKRNDLHMALGNVAARAGQFDLAISQFQTVLKTLEKDSRARGQVYFRLGVTLRKKGDLTNAALALAKAREALPDNSMVADELGLTLQTAGRAAEARQIYQQAVSLDPENGLALNNLAYLLAETQGGDLDMALTYAQRAKQVLPQMNEVSDTLGWIYLKKNMSDNALEIFQDLVTKAPGNPTFRYHLGMAYAQKGDRPKAIQELEQALRDSPPKDEANKIRNMISKLQG